MTRLRKLIMSLTALAVLLSVANRADAFFSPVILGTTECNKIQMVSFLGPIGPKIPVEGVQPGECLVDGEFDPSGNIFFALGSKGNIYKLDLLIFIDRIEVKARLVKTLPSSFLSGESTLAFNTLTKQLKLISKFNEVIQLDPDTGRIDVTNPFSYSANDPFGENPANIDALAFDEISTKETGIPTFKGIDAVSDTLVQLRLLGNQVELKSIKQLGFDADQNKAVGFSIFGNTNLLTMTKMGESRGKTFVVDENGNVKEKEAPPLDFTSVTLGAFVPQYVSDVLPPATSGINNRAGASAAFADAVTLAANNQGGITIEVFDNAKGRPAEREDIAEIKVRITKQGRLIAEGTAMFEKAGLFKFNYSSGETGIHNIEIEGKSTAGDSFFSVAQQQWVGPTTILDVEKKGKKLMVSGVFNADDQIFINGQKQKTAPDSTTPTTLLIAKKGGKVTQDGASIIVRGANNQSNEFIFNQTVIDAACHLSPPQVSSRVGVEQELTLQVFANGRLTDPDPASARFDVSRMVTATDEALVTGGSGTRQSAGVFSFKYSSNQPRFDTIRASGTIKGRAFSCEAFKSWTPAQ